MPELPAIVSRLELEAQVLKSPCGSGSLAWHHWPRTGEIGAGEIGPAVVLLHGGSGSWTHWFPTIPALRERSDVYAVDLPGLGDSAMPPEPLTPDTCGRVVADGIRLLLGDRRPHLVGFSFGGHVGTYAAIALGDRIRDLTLVGCSALGLPHPPDMAQLPKERSSMDEAARREVHRRTLEVLMIRDPARIDALAIALQAANVAKARFRSREFARSDDIKQRLAEVRVPVNAVWGARDVLAYPSLDDVRLALATHQPHLRWRTVSDAGHWVMYEQSTAFNRALIETLGL